MAAGTTAGGRTPNDPRPSFVIIHMNVRSLEPISGTGMPEQQPAQNPSDIAAEWFARRQDDAFGAEDEQRFQHWLAASATHRAAYARIESVWQRYAQVPAGTAGLEPSDTGHARRHRRLFAGRRRRIAALAAGVLLAVATGALVGELPVYLADHRTGLAERRSLSLPDGSQVELASNTALSVAFDKRQREVRLLRGQAYFQVAADASRPFVVVSAQGRSRALGTAFDVARGEDDSVVVTVTEHAVEVSSASGQRADVGSGYRLRYGAQGLGAVETADLGTALAWRRDRLAFRSAPLGEVAQALARHRRGTILVTDAQLAELPVTAVFDVHDTDAALDTIAATLPVRLVRLGGYLALISPRH